jgi:hypothetical protein
MKSIFANITVQLTGRDGNAFTVMATVTRALKQNGIQQDKINDFLDEAMSADYNNLLHTCMKWVNVK